MLQARKLGTQGLVVPAIGLGCMGMSDSYGPADEAESQATLDRAVELGCTFWDTAEVYGPWRNEEIVGRALKRHPGKITLATKFGFKIVDGKNVGVDSRPENVRIAVEGSLKRLGVETIDLLYQHRVDPDVPIEETIGAMAELVRAGKVRFLGLSEAGPANIRKAHAVHPISAVQSEYSLWERNLEGDVLPVMRELGIGLVPFSPLGRGFLVGTAPKPDELAPGDTRLTIPRLQAGAYEANLVVVELLKSLAAKKGVTPAQIAIAWTLHKGEDIVPIPGTKRRAYLDQNIAAAQVRLDAGELHELESVLPPPVGERYNPKTLALVDR